VNRSILSHWLTGFGAWLLQAVAITGGIVLLSVLGFAFWMLYQVMYDGYEVHKTLATSSSATEKNDGKSVGAAVSGILRAIVPLALGE
jgi:hypothetical protein